MGVYSAAYVQTGKFNSFPQTSGLKKNFFYSQNSYKISHGAWYITQMKEELLSRTEEESRALSVQPPLPIVSTSSRPTVLRSPPPERLHRAPKTSEVLSLHGPNPQTET